MIYGRQGDICRLAQNTQLCFVELCFRDKLLCKLYELVGERQKYQRGKDVEYRMDSGDLHNADRLVHKA